ncbi:MAG: hypothetical protein ACI9GZ_001476 [Bacteroidia bacterium]|jgi:hypothetical protein
MMALEKLLNTSLEHRILMYGFVEIGPKLVQLKKY